MEVPQTGRVYQVELHNGPLDGQRRTILSHGGLNGVAEFETDGEIIRYVSVGMSHEANGRAVWVYTFAP